MAKLVLTVPSAQVTRVVDAVCKYHGYNTNKLPNESKADFIARIIMDTVKLWVNHQETSDTLEAARQAMDFSELDNLSSGVE